MKYPLIYLSIVAAVIAGVTCAVAQQGADLRTWTDTRGRTIEASLVRVDGSSVQLKKRDGKVYTVPIDRLSEQDRAFIRKESTQPTQGNSEAVESTDAKHVRTVLDLKFGDKHYRPGAVFTIEPEKDEVIKGNCSLTFKCTRTTGSSAIPYRLCVAIVAKESGGEMMSMTSPYVQVNGNWTSTPTWPVAQKEKAIDFPVSFGDSGPFSQKIHGKGWVYLFVDDGKGNPLSNIVSVEADVAR